MEKETLETQMKPHFYFLLPISFPLFSFSPPLPLDLELRARIGQAAAAAGRWRPASPRLGGGGQPGRCRATAAGWVGCW